MKLHEGGEKLLFPLFRWISPVFVFEQEGHQIKLIRFGDRNMKIRSNNKAAKKSFNARMGGVLKNVKGQKTLSPAYWSLKAWNT